MLDDRKARILQAIVDDYILTALPVGSRTISRKYISELSSATIRNEMSDLEELGYLDQPHSSSGRVPSYRAFRFYVDQLMRNSSLNTEELKRINGMFLSRIDKMEELLDNTASVLADTTAYASLVTPPVQKSLTLKRVQIVPITSGTALLIVVTDAGVLKDSIIRIPEGLSDDYLYMLSNMLTASLSEHSLEQAEELVNALFSEMGGHRELFASIVKAMEQRGDASSGHIVVGGVKHMLAHPEYSDVERARSLISALESKDKLFTLLERSGGVEMTISIGPEMGSPDMKDCALVSTTYKIGGRDVGRLGVIGPVRMNYPHVIAVLSRMREVLSGLLDHGTDST